MTDDWIFVSTIIVRVQAFEQSRGLETWRSIPQTTIGGCDAEGR